MSPWRNGPSRLSLLLLRLVRAAAICMGLVALGLASAFVSMQMAMERNRIEVPRVVGLDGTAAGALLRELGVTPRVVAEEFSDKIPKGHVSSQRPGSGTLVQPGSEVRLLISRGSDQLSIPDVSGSTLPEAQHILSEAGLTSGPVTRIHSNAHPREAIIAQDPPAGASALRGTTVRLLQSLGPWENVMIMPDLVGREMVTAMNLVRELQVEARVSFEQEVSRRGRVVAQDPPAGATIKVGQHVSITIGE